LYSSRNKEVEKFLGWATKTLFAAHLGTVEQKTKLSSKLLGVDASIVKEVFNKTSSTLPVLYLFVIGYVKDLRSTLNISSKYPDDHIVAKCGETMDLTRRLNEHTATYGKMPGANLELRWFNYVDPQYTKKVEAELLRALGKMDFRFIHKKYDELIIYSKKECKTVIEQYENICRKYTGHIQELLAKIKDIEHELVIIKKDNETLEKEIETLKMDHKNEMKILKKGLEISQMREKINSMKKRKHHK